MFIKNYGCIWLAPDFQSRSIGEISSSLTLVRSPKYIDAYSPQMLSDIYTNFNEISIISSSLTMIANLFNLNQSLSVASHWRTSQTCNYASIIPDKRRGTWEHQKSLKAPSSSQLYEQMIPSGIKKQVQSLDAKICQINLHHHYLLVMYTSIQGWFNSY